MLLNQSVTKNLVRFSVELYSMFVFNKCGEKFTETDHVVKCSSQAQIGDDA